MSLKEQVANVYGVGLGSVGSYQVSGIPHISSPTINDRDETSISFPKVTKNITINKTSAGGELRVHFLSKGAQKPAMRFGDANSNFVLDNYFSIPLGLPANETYTISWWFKTANPLPAGNTYLFWKVPHGGPGTVVMTSKIIHQGSGNTIIRTDLKSSTGAITRIDHFFLPGEFNWNGWHQYTLSVDSGSYRVYVDGGYSKQWIAGTGFTTVLQSLTGGGSAPIGAIQFPREPSQGYTNPSDLAQATVWNRALTDSEVSELYNQGKYKNPQDHSAVDALSHWYAFDNTISSNPDTTDTIYDRAGSLDITVGDSSGESDTATFINGPTDFLTGSNVIGGHHYVSLTDARPSVTLNCKCKELYLSASGSTQTANVMANLTEIDSSRMLALTGSGIDE